jgi:hypothetical protein
VAKCDKCAVLHIYQHSSNPLKTRDEFDYRRPRLQKSEKSGKDGNNAIQASDILTEELPAYQERIRNEPS